MTYIAKKKFFFIKSKSYAKNTSKKYLPSIRMEKLKVTICKCSFGIVSIRDRGHSELCLLGWCPFGQLFGYHKPYSNRARYRSKSEVIYPFNFVKLEKRVF